MTHVMGTSAMGTPASRAMVINSTSKIQPSCVACGRREDVSGRATSASTQKEE